MSPGGALTIQLGPHGHQSSALALTLGLSLSLPVGVYKTRHLNFTGLPNTMMTREGVSHAVTHS